MRIYTKRSLPIHRVRKRNTGSRSGLYRHLAVCIWLLYGLVPDAVAQCTDPIVSKIEVRNPNCYGATQGSVTGPISGGTPPYSVILSGRANAKITINYEGGSFLFGGLIQGDYTITITDANSANGSGCSRSENFTIKAPSELTLEVNGVPASCSAESSGKLKGTIFGGTPPYTYLINGSAVAPDKISNTSNGVNFEIRGLSPGTYLFRITDKNYSSSGNASGCTVAESVQVSGSNNGTLDVELNAAICEGESYQLGTQTLTKSGTYEEMFSTSSGCDSLVTLHLSVGTPGNSTVDVTICEGQSYRLGPQTLRESGIYQETLSSSAGCDSTVTVKLTVLPRETTLDVSICQGQSYKLGSKTLTRSGTYQETFTNSIGCDSVVILNLDIGGGEAFTLKTLPLSQTVCTEETVPISVEISGGTAQYQIRWFDNLNASGAPIGTSETVLVNPNLGKNSYLVEVTDAQGCKIVGTAAVNLLSIDATIDPMVLDVCDDTEEVLITVTNHDPDQQLVYAWEPEQAILTSPAEAEVLADPSVATDFSVKLTNQEGCEATLTSSITNEACNAFSITTDQPVVVTGGSAVLSVAGCDDCQFLWSTGATDSTITVSPVSATTYSVSITTAGGCVCAPLEQTIGVSDCIINPEDFFLPTAFTPDGDQVNDEFCVRSELEIIPDEDVEILLIIYNRWGQELFRGNSFGDCWDGTFQGTPVAPDVYGYHLMVRCTDDSYTQKGDVTILR